MANRSFAAMGWQRLEPQWRAAVAVVGLGAVGAGAFGVGCAASPAFPTERGHEAPPPGPADVGTPPSQPEPDGGAVAPSPPAGMDTGIRPSGGFANIWRTLGEGDGELGYPLADPIGDTLCARQPFPSGHMIWVEARSSVAGCFEFCADPARIFVAVLPTAGATSGPTSFERPDEWSGPHHSCPEAAANGEAGPVRGFGKVWCDDATVKDAVGLPSEPELGGPSYPRCTSQLFQGGIIIDSPLDAATWVITHAGPWHEFPR